MSAWNSWGAWPVDKIALGLGASIFTAGQRFNECYRNRLPVVFSGLSIPAQDKWPDRTQLRELSPRATLVHAGYYSRSF